MCGIAGIISKNERDISTSLLQMLSYIQHRGPDASGIAIFPEEDKVTLRASVRDEGQVEDLLCLIKEYGTVLDQRVIPAGQTIPLVEVLIDMKASDIQALHLAINKVDGLAVHSLGNHIKVYKEGGHLENLTQKYKVDTTPCRHGIGHVRMATESAEDINAAHPFVSPFYPELAIVHNGQFTNYFKLRRFLEAKGAKFKTLNDSEAASHLIAYAMRENNGDLESALRYALQQMDGIFCIIAATDSQIGIVKDKLGIKPLLVVEAEDYILMGSEQIEFSVIGDNIFAEEMEPGEVRIWNV